MQEDNLKTILEASYKSEGKAKKDLNKLGYKYDTELSSNENKVFYNPKTGEPSIAYRGSQTGEDWLGNLKLLLGAKDLNAERRIALAGKVKEKYNKPPTSYGHSRGGYIAEQAGERYGGKSVTYNKATLPQDVFKKIRIEQTDIRTLKDPVSLLSVLQRGNKKVINSRANVLDSHSINFLP